MVKEIGPQNTPYYTSLDAQQTIFVVQESLKEFSALDETTCSVLPTGSTYRGTSVPGSSDTDILVVLGIEGQLDIMARQKLWVKFNSNVHSALIAKLGENSVSQANKCIDLTPICADIVPCLARTINIGNKATSAIEFWTNNEPSEHILGFPDLQHKNVAAKNLRTQGAYVKLVKTLKKLKEKLVDASDIDPRTAPSYMLESSAMCMPDSLFTGEPTQDLKEYIKFMQAALSSPSSGHMIRHGSGLYHLIGDNPHTQWTEKRAHSAIRIIGDNVKTQDTTFTSLPGM